MRRTIGALAVLLAACDAPTSGVTHQYPAMDSASFNTFANNCSVCHAPPQPTTHTAAEWPQVIERMNSHRLQRGLPAIADQDRPVILQYLQRHAKGTSS